MKLVSREIMLLMEDWQLIRKANPGIKFEHTAIEDSIETLKMANKVCTITEDAKTATPVSS